MEKLLAMGSHKQDAFFSKRVNIILHMHLHTALYPISSTAPDKPPVLVNIGSDSSICKYNC